jgi:hypothetical protein
MSEQLPPDLTPEDVTYYNLCAEGAWNQYQATGDESYARICLAYFAKLMIAEQRVNGGQDDNLRNGE